MSGRRPIGIRRPGARWRAALLALSLGALTLVGCGGGPATMVDPDDAPELVGVWYTVEPGDSVSLIARRHDVPMEDIIELNGLVDPDRLEVGQALFLYGVDELLERHAAKVAAASAKPSGGAGASSGRGAARAPAPRPGKPSGESSPKPAQSSAKPKPSPYIWPVDGGTLTSGFGRRGRRMHKGIDIAADPGTPIKAVADGKVIYSDNKQRGYGNLVILQHAGDVVTVYAHNRRNLVDEGDTVRQGAVIAELGNTGRSTGPHLHFELRLKSKAVDPLVHLPAR